MSDVAEVVPGSRLIISERMTRETRMMTMMTGINPICIYLCISNIASMLDQLIVINKQLAKDPIITTMFKDTLLYW